MILRILMIAAAFVATGPYFFWGYEPYIITALLVVNLAVYTVMFIRGQYTINQRDFVYLLWLIILLTWLAIPEAHEKFSAIGLCLQIGSLGLFILLPLEEKAKIFDGYRTLFAISLIPGMFYWIMIVVFSYPFDWTYLASSHLGKDDLGVSYQQYPLAVFMTQTFVDAELLPRLCALYDEPGVVGTISGLLLVGSKMRLSWKSVLLLLGGVFSLSYAFIAIIMIYAFIKSRKAALIGVVLIIGLGIFAASLDEDNIANKYFFNRLTSGETMLSVDNRSNVAADEAFDSQRGDAVRLLFGYGKGAFISNYERAQTATWKSLAYDYGFIGFFAIVITFVFYAMRISKKRDAVLLLAIFLLSIYQRPFVFTLNYFICLFGGIAYIAMSYDTNVVQSTRLNWREIMPRSRRPEANP